MDPRMNRTKKLLKMTLKKELENNALEHITVTQLCEKSTINKTTFYRHYKDVLKDIFSDGLDATYEDYSLFFSSPYEFFLLNNKEENTENFIYFEKQLRENPVELFDDLYFDLFRKRIYQNRLLPIKSVLKVNTSLKHKPK